MAGRGADDLLERDGELSLLTGALARAQAGSGGLVLVEGPPGVGKTALLRRLRGDAGAAGVRVLGAVGGELEREFAFGLVRQLFEPVVLGASPAERERLLAGAAALAGPVVGAAPDGAAPAADASFATLHGLYWLVAALAEQEALLLVIDDAHWADAPSLRFVDFLARRVEELPVLVVVGMRPREPGAEHALLAHLADAPRVEVLRPAVLSEDGVRRLVSDGLGEATPDAVVSGALNSTGGNPLLVRELIRTLAATGSAATAQAVRDAVPSSVTHSVQRRLSRLPAAAQELARAVAVLGARRDAALIAAVTGYEHGEVVAALEALRDSGLVEDDPPRFAHPLLGQAVAERVTSRERDALHHRAAELLRARRGSEEEVVVHLLAAGPLGAAWVVAFLREAAERALSEGAPDAAVRRLRRALEELGGDDAPEAGAVHLELGRAAASAGDPSAPEHLILAAHSTDPGVVVGATVTQLTVGAYTHTDTLMDVVARLRAAVDRLGADADPALRDEHSAQLLNALIIVPDRAAAYSRALAELSGDPGPGVLAHLAWDAAAGDATRDEALAVARAALAGRPFTRYDAVEHPTPLWALIALTVLDGKDDAAPSIADWEATLKRRPSALGRAFLQLVQAELLLAFGSIALCEVAARESLELLEAGGVQQTAFSVVAALASALVLRGQLDEADAVLGTLPPDAHFETAWGGGSLWGSRAQLRIAQGRPRDAVADLRRVDGHRRGYGWQRFPRLPHEAELARALMLAGEREEGVALAQTLVAEAHRRGVALLEAEALISLGLGLEGEPGLEALRAAAEVAERSPSLLVRARAALELGAALRRANQRRDAREQVAVARDLAHRIDATALVARATEELTVAGGRPRRIALSGVEALTPSERRVAELAAQGLSNREIAETLFVTRKTVEFQLGGTYSKLGIRSRAQLAEILAGTSDGPG